MGNQKPEKICAFEIDLNKPYFQLTDILIL